MKQIVLTLISLTLLLGLTQCTKNDEPEPTPVPELVHITLDPNGGEKNIVYPETGVGVFENGDKVYVANNGHYVGMLTYDGSYFDGTISSPSTEDYLYFYFLGNKVDPSDEASFTVETTTITVNISDQASCYPQIAYAPSTVKYSSSVSGYKAILLNQCALVKFTATPTTLEFISLKGMNNQVTVNLNPDNEHPRFNNSQNGEGTITIGKRTDSNFWAIMLPQEAKTDVQVVSDDYEGTIANLPAIVQNTYLNDGIPVSLTTP